MTKEKEIKEDLSIGLSWKEHISKDHLLFRYFALVCNDNVWHLPLMIIYLAYLTNPILGKKISQ